MNYTQEWFLVSPPLVHLSSLLSGIFWHFFSYLQDIVKAAVDCVSEFPFGESTRERAFLLVLSVSWTTGLSNCRWLLGILEQWLCLQPRVQDFLVCPSLHIFLLHRCQKHWGRGTLNQRSERVCPRELRSCSFCPWAGLSLSFCLIHVPLQSKNKNKKSPKARFLLSGIKKNKNYIISN